jgi:glutathione S-transferase
MLGPPGMVEGTDYHFVQVSMADAEHKKGGKHATPNQKLPMLETDDGTKIAESVAICRYIEETASTDKAGLLFGKDPTERALIEMWARRLELELKEAGTSRAWANGPVVAPMRAKRGIVSHDSELQLGIQTAQVKLATATCYAFKSVCPVLHPLAQREWKLNRTGTYIVRASTRGLHGAMTISWRMHCARTGRRFTVRSTRCSLAGRMFAAISSQSLISRCFARSTSAPARSACKQIHPTLDPPSIRLQLVRSSVQRGLMVCTWLADRPTHWDELPNLTAWHKRVCERPSVKLFPNPSLKPGQEQRYVSPSNRKPRHRHVQFKRISAPASQAASS